MDNSIPLLRWMGDHALLIYRPHREGASTHNVDSAEDFAFYEMNLQRQSFVRLLMINAHDYDNTSTVIKLKSAQRDAKPARWL